MRRTWALESTELVPAVQVTDVNDTEVVDTLLATDLETLDVSGEAEDLNDDFNNLKADVTEVEDAVKLAMESRGVGGLSEVALASVRHRIVTKARAWEVQLPVVGNEAHGSGADATEVVIRLGNVALEGLFERFADWSKARLTNLASFIKSMGGATPAAMEAIKHAEAAMDKAAETTTFPMTAAVALQTTGGDFDLKTVSKHIELAKTYIHLERSIEPAANGWPPRFNLKPLDAAFEKAMPWCAAVNNKAKLAIMPGSVVLACIYRDNADTDLWVSYSTISWNQSKDIKDYLEYVNPNGCSVTKAEIKKLITDTKTACEVLDAGVKKRLEDSPLHKENAETLKNTDPKIDKETWLEATNQYIYSETSLRAAFQSYKNIIRGNTAILKEFASAANKVK